MPGNMNAALWFLHESGPVFTSSDVSLLCCSIPACTLFTVQSIFHKWQVRGSPKVVKGKQDAKQNIQSVWERGGGSGDEKYTHYKHEKTQSQGKQAQQTGKKLNRTGEKIWGGEEAKTVIPAKTNETAQELKLNDCTESTEAKIETCSHLFFPQRQYYHSFFSTTGWTKSLSD